MKYIVMIFLLTINIYAMEEDQPTERMQDNQVKEKRIPNPHEAELEDINESLILLNKHYGFEKTNSNNNDNKSNNHEESDTCVTS